MGAAIVSTRTRVSAASAAILSVVLTAYALGNVAANAWTVIDDHEIMAWVGARERLPPSEMGPVLARTEAARPSPAGRFRPLYYALRVGEAVLFGRNVAAWYLAHEIMFALSAFLVAFTLLRYVARDWIEGALSAAGTALVFSRYCFTEIFSRLGPSESYAAVGTALAALGFVAVFAGGERRARFHLSALAGTLLAAGSKENFLVLAVPLAVLAVKHGRELPAAVRAALWVGLLLLSAQGAWIVAIVSTRGSDLYGNAVSVESRLSFVASFLRRPEVRWAGGGGLALSAALLAWRRMRAAPLGESGRRLAALAAVLLGCTLLAATQFVFYNGKLPWRGRYDFPYVTLFDAALVAALIVGVRTAAALLPRRRSGRFPTMAAALVASAGLAASAALVREALPGLRTTRSEVRSLRRENLAFDRRLAFAVDEMRRRSSPCVVLYAHRGLDSEPVGSLSRHLVARSVRVPIYAAVADGARAEGAWEAGLLADLRGLSRTGWEGSISPLPEGGASGCYGLGLDGSPPERSAGGVEIWPIRPDEWGPR